MAKRTQKWREFEELVAAIYTQATPEATVQHNYFIVGKSGRRRQIDVSIKAKQGLHSYLTVVECKRYARRVGIRDVEAFITKIKDVRANKGVMVSTVGFDDGARAQAEQYDVTLFSYREAVETDWEKVAAASVWVTFITEQFIPEYMIAELEDGTAQLIHPTETLCDSSQEECLTSLALASSMITEHPFLAATPEAATRRGPGPMWIKGRINTSAGKLFIRGTEPRQPIDYVTIQGYMLMEAFSVNPVFESGHIIEDALTGQRPYTQVLSSPINLQAVIRSQEGRELTMEEYQESTKQRFFIPPEATTDDSRFRITITSPSAETVG